MATSEERFLMTIGGNQSHQSAALPEHFMQVTATDAVPSPERGSRQELVARSSGEF